MTQEEYRTALDWLIWLSTCALNGDVPDKTRVEEMNLEQLYQAAKQHLLTGIIGYALEADGIYYQSFVQAKAKAIRKTVLIDQEREEVCKAFDEAGIWYMPLKGAVMKDLYPSIGMRQMADNDILIDPDRAEDAKSIMERLGFTTEYYGVSNHDIYHKPPVSNFEIHTALFSHSCERTIAEYYRNVKDRLIRDKENGCSYHFSDEDFYIYMISHEYKHFSMRGTGLRSLLDVYVFFTKKGDGLDWRYIEQEIKKLGIAVFERTNRSLAMHLFSGKQLTDGEREMLEYILFSGTYGTEKNYVQNQIQRKGRFGYLFSRAFLPLHSMTSLYPILKRFPILLPVFWVVRIVQALETKPARAIYQFKAAFGIINTGHICPLSRESKYSI